MYLEQPQKRFVEVGRHCEQDLSKIIKNSPQKHEAKNTRYPEHHHGRMGSFSPVHPSQFGKTSGANHPIFVLGYALAAKGARAFEAARHRLTVCMIEAAKMRYFIHIPVLSLTGPPAPAAVFFPARRR